MDRQRRFKIGIKSKKKKKVCALKNTLHIHFWFQVNFFMQTKPYIYRFFLENLNIIHILKVIEPKTQMSRGAAWRGAARRGERTFSLFSRI